MGGPPPASGPVQLGDDGFSWARWWRSPHNKHHAMRFGVT